MLSLDSRVFTLPGSLHWATVEMSGVGRPHKCLVLAALTSGGHPHKWWPPSQMVTALTSGVRPHNLHPCRVQPFSLHTSRTHTLVVCDHHLFETEVLSLDS